MILCDTDIFIEAFKNNTLATGSLKRVGFQNIALSAITLMELYFGALNKKELLKIKSRLKQLEIITFMIKQPVINIRYFATSIKHPETNIETY